MTLMCCNFSRPFDGFGDYYGQERDNFRPWGKLKICRNPNHNPPTMKVYQPGIHTHTCPGCGKSTKIVIPEKFL